MEIIICNTKIQYKLKFLDLIKLKNMHITNTNKIK